MKKKFRKQRLNHVLCALANGNFTIEFTVNGDRTLQEKIPVVNLPDMQKFLQPHTEYNHA